MIRFDDIVEKASVYISEKDVLVLQKAYVFAARAHKGQVRRSGEPYLSHPLEVANTLADMHLDRTTLVAALLHDVLEDTEVTAAEVRERFGKDVAELVAGVTKIGRVQDTPPEDRRAETIRKIILAMTDDIRVIFIKLADRIHNLKTLEFLGEEKQRQVARETLDVYAPIADRLGMGRIRAELEDLSFRYVEPEGFAKVEALVGPQKKAAEKDLRRMQKALEGLMKKNRIPAEVFSRLKRPFSIWTKMKKRDIGFDQVYDFLALRLIADSIKDCYAALGVIHQRWPHLPQRFRDFIAMPKPNLYQSLHTTVITEGRKMFEVQVRTREMHDLAENGIAAHWRYKDDSPQSLMREDRRLHWLREMAALYKEQKNPQEFLRSLKAHLVPEEVYVFTPKGRVVNLPPGATALDFAFKVHSEIGLHAAGARINGAQAPLKTPLKTGDIVEIMTAEDRTPTRAILGAARTSGARHQIKRWLKLKGKPAVGAAPAGRPRPRRVRIRALDDAAIRLAKCCSPIKGEPVVGYVTAGRDLTVHSLRCPLVTKEILDAHRLVDVSWDPSLAGTFRARLLVKAQDSPGVLANVAAAVSRFDGNITKAEVATFAGEKARISLELLIRDLGHLEEISKRIAALKEVLSVERV
ncbi:MAG TPA: bifunctional (p)ppGpp synthetase/guanosine-3',5'-bis(diphosphate) 3'-pyrophosphohydrolase [Burkholderiales bacterium]|nr:bifunctional (p)ppGpp synthetase/guanosine-3',5'-bis(diphosphate) 3'-pyrophosphohydrolase [Burkholderiales bacterium]